MMSAGALPLVGLVAIVAGFVNALAGGGTLLSFPVLTAVGLPAVVANVTNTVALCPGFVGGTFAQRADLRGQGRRLALVLPAGAVGGAAGAMLLLHTDEHVFRVLVPYLIFGAALLLALQSRLRAWIVRRAGAGSSSEGAAAGAVAIAAIYGGYFGAGLSVIVLAVLGLSIDDTLTRLNAVKQTVAFAANATAAMFFVFSGHVLWPVAAIMAVGALAGGALGGGLAARVKPEILRAIVVSVGFVVAGIYWVRWR